MTALRLEGVTRRYDAAHPPAVAELSLAVGEGEVFALVGPSGCGKTTTLRIIAGFEPLDAGRVWLGEAPLGSPQTTVPPERRRIGIVFQDYALFPHLSVLENVTFGLFKLPRAERRRRAMHLLAMVGMESLAHRRPQQLSGGQQQRVALARSLAPTPQILLMDEPFSNLDASLRGETRRHVRRLLKETGTAALLVTHDQEEALSFADRVGVMRGGRLLQTGPPAEVYNAPVTAFVAQFLGRTNLMVARAAGRKATTPIGPVCLDRHAQGRVLVSLRPEHLRIVPPADGRRVGRVVIREFKGRDLTLTICFGDCRFVVQADCACSCDVGQSVSLTHAAPAVIVRDDV